MVLTSLVGQPVSRWGELWAGAFERHSAALPGPDVEVEHAVADREFPFECSKASAASRPACCDSQA